MNKSWFPLITDPPFNLVKKYWWSISIHLFRQNKKIELIFIKKKQWVSIWDLIKQNG